MLAVRIALVILLAGLLEFFSLFLWCIFIDLKHKNKDKDESEI